MAIIREIKADEIPKVKDFPPADWHFDIVIFLEQHLGQPYFYAVVAIESGKIIAAGNVIINGNTSWLGNIIVKEKHRERGIGKQITKHLIDYSYEKKCNSLLLIATQYVKPLYKKLGFQVDSYYTFLRPKLEIFLEQNKHIRAATQEDIGKISNLDSMISDENRIAFLHQFMNNAFVYENSGKINGFYLPDLGSGFIAALDHKAGLPLLDFRNNQKGGQVVIPHQNKAALYYLLNQGYSIEKSAARMYLGYKTSWKSEHVYCRGAGYCG